MHVFIAFFVWQKKSVDLIMGEKIDSRNRARPEKRTMFAWNRYGRGKYNDAMFSKKVFRTKKKRMQLIHGNS